MSEQTDLTNCDREPIHIPGSVQPHATLLVLQEPSLSIMQASANAPERLGMSMEELLKMSLADLLPAADLEHLEKQILSKQLEASPHYLPPLAIGKLGQSFEVLVHRHQGVLIMEMELWEDQNSMVQEEVYTSLKHTLNQLQGTTSVVEFCQRAAEHVSKFTGFDRIMVYRFADDASGHVIAEARRADLESYLGLHYPASDIPKQARKLFVRSQLRLNPDVRYKPVPLVPEMRPDTAGPLDMSYCVSRSMSPIHAEYLQNMGVTASMSISIVIGDELWGLFACHHYSPRYVSHTTRMACEFLAHMLSLQVSSKESDEQHEYKTKLLHEHRLLADAMSMHSDFSQVLIQSPGKTFAGIEAGGSALIYNDEVHLRGNTPEAAAVHQLAAKLAQETEPSVWSTDHLGSVVKGLKIDSSMASGLLAARLSKQHPAYLMWFRPEETQTMKWAGDPTKPVETGPHGDRLTPRKSFELWQQEVRGKSVPWLACEIEAARLLRQTILESEVRRAEQLTRLNIELDERNRQLDSFAYVASHDLKEPLRGINNYSNFLMEDYAGQLDDQGMAYLRTMMRLTERMETLLDSLLYYSRLSRAEIRAQKVNLMLVVEDALEMLIARREETGAKIVLAENFPPVDGDADRLSEVFSNLISNAIKYNDKKPPEITLGWLPSEDSSAPVFYVRDNGIGIAKEHQQLVFQIFKRLHAREQYGGGVGAGLTIVRKIIERHGGRIWLESRPGQGTTFYFTLQPDSPNHD
ncbi:light-regulated signal transduction histidine kinase (bacteriophytochrome) [Prosthecobacter fusiformis]|uniref:histidine kinase n=1 Tax=Prosthecobacter fusiformis TaxID=48464 RepID=A0A4R7RWC1_9BACT|nr:ATP-binding protein [Prosthecobacter fusiformis]TDU69308.1 light-regulated signal transduction histidine kinase (bacteriophytochrome) [Prosthecobacter fusiformis]